MVLCADFGGQRTKLGLVEDARVAGWAVVESPATAESSEWLPELKEAVTALCQSAGIRMADLEGMVWALPLIIDPGLRRATWSFGKFADTTREDFCSRAEEMFGLPLVMENDARAAAIGEWQEGAGRGCRNLAMVTLGTGIGTGVILDGRPMRGRSGMAGNLGGLSVTHLGCSETDALPPGCTEGRVATWALPRRAAAMPQFANSALSGESPLNYEAVFAHAGRGDAVAGRLRAAAFEAWGAVALNLLHAYDPERLVFGGGIMASADVILPAVREFVARHAVQAGGPVDIVAAELGDQAAVFGGDWIWNNAGARGE